MAPFTWGPPRSTPDMCLRRMQTPTTHRGYPLVIYWGRRSDVSVAERARRRPQRFRLSRAVERPLVGACVVIAQLELFNAPKVRHTDGDTSRDAARAVQQHAGALENLILTEFSLHDYLTDEELCGWLPDVYGPTVRTCRSRLTKRGLLLASGQRENSRGRLMTIWRMA
jgi:hypothetical protein